MMITLIFLVIYLGISPFYTNGLNRTQNGALIAQLLTLFVGIMFVVDAYLQLQATAAGQPYDTKSRTVVAVIIFAFNMGVLGWPVIEGFLGSDVKKRIVDYIAARTWEAREHEAIVRHQVDQVMADEHAGQEVRRFVLYGACNGM